MHHKTLIVSTLLASLLLGSCSGGVGPVDSKRFLNALDGPKVPTVEDALTESAHAAEAQGDFKQAAQFYTQVLGKNPDNKEAMLALGDSYRRDGQTDKALQVYDGLLAKDEGNLGAKEGKGLALIASGDFDTPAVLFEEIMKADPTRWKTLNALGILFTTRNMQPEAQQYFTEALKFHKDNPSILNNLGLSQALDRKFDDSIATLGKSSALAATGSLERKRIDLNLALVYAIAGRLEDARTTAEPYLSGAALDNNLGLYAHLAKDDQMARSYLNKALTDSKVYYARAWDNLEEINNSKNDDDAKADKKAPAKSKVTVKKSSKPAPRNRRNARAEQDTSERMKELFEPAPQASETPAAPAETPVAPAAAIDTNVNYGGNAQPAAPAPAPAAALSPPPSQAAPETAPAPASPAPNAGASGFRPHWQRFNQQKAAPPPAPVPEVKAPESTSTPESAPESAPIESYTN